MLGSRASQWLLFDRFVFGRRSHCHLPAAWAVSVCRMGRVTVSGYPRTMTTFLAIASWFLAGQRAVVPTAVPQPVYPPIAVSAMVRGDVVVNVVVRPDGSVVSAAVESGAPLLRDVAPQAAQQAEYECRGCTEVGTPYSLVFTFRVVGRDEPKPATGLTFDREGRATVNVVGVIGYWWEGVVFSETQPRARSPKCLWLWRCGA